VPLIVKKNKNESGNLYQIFYSNKKHNPIVSIISYNLFHRILKRTSHHKPLTRAATLHKY